MFSHFHHAHLFASDINATLEFYQEMFGGKIVADVEMAGARNVFLQIGKGRLHFYEQPPRDEGRGAIHHLGIETDDLEALVTHMKSRGVKFKKEVADFGFWKYVMAPAPDNVILELFQPVKEKFPVHLPDNFF
jgi:catechol 2,3-dioxygenase-like lactoylglutathione lyase family enzyme